MLDMTELLDDHQPVCSCTQRVAYAVDVVSGKVDEHDVLRSILEACSQFVCKLEIFSRRGTSLDSASDGMCDYAVGVGLTFDKELRRCADEMKV